jgi:alkaline phosphatase D
MVINYKIKQDYTSYMHRREIIRSFFFGTSAKSLMNSDERVIPVMEDLQPDTANSFKSKWHLLPDKGWTDEALCVQGLQDWCIKDGALNCVTHGADRTVHVLTHQLSADNSSFRANLIFRFLNQPDPEADKENFAGFRLGVTGRFEDDQSVLKIGKGIDAGITRNGYLFIGTTISDKKVDEKKVTEKIRLRLSLTPQSTGGNFAKLKALDKSGNTLATLSSAAYDAAAWGGDITLVSNCKANKENTDQPTIAINKFEIEGEKITLRLKNNSSMLSS